MTIPDNYKEINRQSWNLKTEIHLKSDFYNVEGFKQGTSSLQDIEITLLGNLTGKTLLHLQCHFGQDTISLERLGAHVTGVDLSDAAIEAARTLAQEMESQAQFVCCDLYELPQHLDEQFDIVFTSYGTIGWLPDLDRWGKIISRYLKPGGKFVIVEFHPVIWMFDDSFSEIQYSYFNKEVITGMEAGTYADTDAPVNSEYICWNHSLADVFKALIDNGLSIKEFVEYDYSPYNIFGDMKEVAPRQYTISKYNGKLPLVYALVATKE